MNVLFAADGSDHTTRVLVHLAAHAWLRDARWTVLHAVPAITHHAASFLAPDVVAGHYRDEADRVLAPVCERLAAAGVRAQRVAAHGHAAAVIAEHARSMGCDLLVMGSHGHGHFGNVVLGSVATRVVADTRCPVLLLR